MTVFRAAGIALAAIPLFTATATTSALAESTPQTGREEVHVLSSVPHGATSEQLTQGASVLTGDLLDHKREGTLGETLSGLPGISSTFFGPGASRPVIRGQSGPRVRILMAGIGSIDASSVSPDHAVAGEGLSVERIEIIRGPSTLLYGPEAIGGVVNIFDGRIPTSLPIRTVTGMARYGFGSNADEHALAARIDTRIGKNLVLHLDGFLRDADDYRVPAKALLQNDDHELGDDHDDDHDDHENDPPGFVENASLRSKSGSVGLSYIGNRGFIGVSVTGLTTNYGVPGHGHGHDEELEDAHEDAYEDAYGGEEEAVRIDLKQTRVDVVGQLDTNFLTFKQAKFRFGWADYDHAELEGSETGTLFTNRGWEARIDLVQQDTGPLSGAMGLSVKRRNFDAIGLEAFTPRSRTTAWGVFAAEEYEAGPVILQAGLRLDHTDIKRVKEGGDRRFTQISTALGAIWQASDSIRFTINLSRTERAPTAEELFSEGPHLATDSFELGNPDLGKETAYSAEFGLHVHTGPVDMELSFYATAYKDYIFLMETGDMRDDLPLRIYSQGNARFHGMELEVGVNVTSSIRARAQLDWVRARLNAGKEDLPRIPPLRLTGGLDVRSDRLDAGLEVQYVAAQNRVAPLEARTAGHVLVNAVVNWRPFADRPHVSLSVRGRNLLNNAAFNHASFVKAEAPLPGRDIRFTLDVQL